MFPSCEKLSVALSCLLSTTVSLAGPLDPPTGPVTASGKVLADLEPRVAISSTTTPGDADCLFKITQSGSYYFTGDIVGVPGKNGIKIALGPAGGHISIDMEGFSLRGVPGSLSGLVWAGPDLDATKCLWDLDNDGMISDWGDFGIMGRGVGRISGIRIESAGAGCLSLSAGGGSATVIDHCKLRTTSGLAFTNAASAPCVIRNSIIEGDGCNATSLCYHGGPVMTGDTGYYLRSSTFSGSVIEVAPSGSFEVGAGGWSAHFSGVVATSALHVSPGSLPVSIMAHEAEEVFLGCTFSNAMVDIARDNTRLSDLNIYADSSTSAPAGVRLWANNSIVSGGRAGDGTVGLRFTAAVPLAMDVAGSNNLISGCSITSGATGIRLTGARNTVRACILNKSGNDPITNIVIGSGATGTLVVKNEFRNAVGGVSVSNLGGPTNIVAPIVTPANLDTASNPFSNVQH